MNNILTLCKCVSFPILSWGVAQEPLGHLASVFLVLGVPLHPYAFSRCNAVFQGCSCSLWETFTACTRQWCDFLLYNRLYLKDKSFEIYCMSPASSYLSSQQTLQLCCNRKYLISTYSVFMKIKKKKNTKKTCKIHNFSLFRVM